MAILGREFIAVPDDRKNQIVFKWPDVNIRKMTRAIVDADQMAIFVNTGQVIGTMGPGKHQIDADELPFLGAFIDFATGGNAYRAELFFVGTREYTGNTFGGRIDDVQDPQTGMIVTLRVFGDYSLQVKDATTLITNLTGTVDVTDNQAITYWVSDQLLKVMRTEVTQQIVRNGWPVLGLSAYTPDLEQTVVEKGNEQLATYGLALVRMGNFDVNLSDDDEATLKGLAKDTAFSRLAGSFQQYASGEMMKGAGEGMAKGGSGTGGAFIAAGLGVGQQAAAPQQPGPTPPPGPGFVGGGAGFTGGPGGQGGPGAATAPGATTVECPQCHTANA
ncbi:MAG TPA: SPFH domain-containing protein, partial [Acidimicrobiales bacterium]